MPKISMDGLKLQRQERSEVARTVTLCKHCSACFLVSCNSGI